MSVEETETWENASISLGKLGTWTPESCINSNRSAWNSHAKNFECEIGMIENLRKYETSIVIPNKMLDICEDLQKLFNLQR